LYYSHDLFQGEIRERKTELRGKIENGQKKKSQKKKPGKRQKNRKANGMQMPTMWTILEVAIITLLTVEFTGLARTKGN
jgi:hypothetical protein